MKIQLTVLTLALTSAFATNAKLKVDVGYFQPSQKILREVYSGGVTYKGEVDVRTYDELYVFGLGDYFSKEGRTEGLHTKTDLRIGGAAVGLQYVFKLHEKVRLFVGLGPKYFFFKTHDDTQYLPKTTTKSGLGGIAKAGFEFYVNDRWFFDVYADYSYKRMHFHARPSQGSYFSTAIQVGGVSAGGGVGVAF